MLVFDHGVVVKNLFDWVAFQKPQDRQSPEISAHTFWRFLLPVRRIDSMPELPQLFAEVSCNFVVGEVFPGDFKQ